MSIDLRHKKIVVTGGAGFVGRHVVKNLIEKRGVPETNILVPRSEEFDLRTKEHAQKAIKGRDIVFHLAAFSGGIGFNRAHPGRMFYDNALMGLNVAEAAHSAGVEKFVHTGSYNEYPNDAPVPLKEDTLWDGLPEASLLPYGMAKRMLLTQMQVYRAEDGFPGAHLVMASMYGPGYDPDSTTLIPSLIWQVKEAKAKGQPVIGWGTGRATRDFLYVEDAAEGIVLAAECYDRPEPLNLGGGREVPMQELLATLCRLMDFTGEIHWDSSKPEGQLRYVLDISRAENNIGFVPSVGLESGLSETLL